jgi:hypothetical protein
MKETAPRDALGCIIDSGQEAKTEILDQKHPSGTPLAVRFLPSLTDFTFLLPVVLVFGLAGGASFFLRDGDTGWHIRTGEWILQNGRVPDQDLFSFTKAGSPWVAFEWLWDLICAWLHRWGGMAAVVLLSVSIVSLTSALLFRLVRRKCGNDFIALAVSMLAIIECGLHWLARPHLITVLFLVVFLSVLDRLDEKFTRLWLVLPVLCLVWTNLHGGFLAGLVLIGCYAGGELIRWVVEPATSERTPALARAGRYILVGGICALSTLVNPYGFRLHLHLWHLSTDPLQKSLILEWQPFSFLGADAIFFEIMILLGAVAAFRSLCHKEFTHALLFAVWCHLALKSRRHAELFFCVVAPFVAATLHELLSSLQSAPISGWIRRAAAGFQTAGAEFQKTERAWRFHWVSILGWLAVAALLHAPAPLPAFRAQFDPRAFPVRAVDALGKSVLTRRVFTTDGWGGYLIYRLYPSTRVFVDGRSDFYGAKFVQSFVQALQARYDWEEHLTRFGVEVVLLPVGAPLAGALKESARWSVSYDDGTAIIFRPNSQAGPPRGASSAAISE